jgi:hypothetical protein
MRIVLILTDTTGQCHKALEYLKEVSEKFSAKMEVFVVLEDVYKLEKASVSLGFPLPPDTVPQTKEKVIKKLRHMWEHIDSSEIDITVVAGELREEVLKFTGSKGDLGMLIWGCSPSPNVCRVIDDIEIPSLIIK